MKHSASWGKSTFVKFRGCIGSANFGCQRWRLSVNTAWGLAKTSCIVNLFCEWEKYAVGASQVNLHSEIIKPLWVHNTSLGSDEHSYGGHINQSGARGSQEGGGVKLQCTKIVNMLQLGCNACQILPWVIRSKKLNHMKFIQCFVLEIKVKIMLHRGQIFNLVRF